MAFEFQKNVGLYNKEAIAGDRANQNPTVYDVVNYLSGDSGVKMGGFAFASTSHPETQVVSTGSSVAVVKGFVERVMNISGFTYDPASVTIPEGGNVSVARKGDFFVESDGAVSVGATVYAKEADGSATFTSTDAVDTGFKAATAASASGELVIITNW